MYVCQCLLDSSSLDPGMSVLMLLRTWQLIPRGERCPCYLFDTRKCSGDFSPSSTGFLRFARRGDLNTVRNGRTRSPFFLIALLSPSPTTLHLFYFLVLPDGSTTWRATRWLASSREATCGRPGRTGPPSSTSCFSMPTGASTTSTGSG